MLAHLNASQLLRINNAFRRRSALHQRTTTSAEELQNVSQESRTTCVTTRSLRLVFLLATTETVSELLSVFLTVETTGVQFLQSALQVTRTTSAEEPEPAYQELPTISVTSQSQTHAIQMRQTTTVLVHRIACPLLETNSAAWTLSVFQIEPMLSAEELLSVCQDLRTTSVINRFWICLRFAHQVLKTVTA